MKVGILTFHRAHNYGAVLQCYALQEILKKMGHEVEVVDYRQEWTEEVYKVFSLKVLKERYHTIRGRVGYIVRCIQNYKKRRRTERLYSEFRNKYLCLSHVYCENDYFDYDACIIGSDQLWGINCTGGELDAVFAGNIKMHKKSKIIGYAISSNVQSIDYMSQKKVLCKTISNFSSLSFREGTVISRISSYTGKTFSQCIDPTLLTNKYIWKQLISKKWENRDYIVCYRVRGNGSNGFSIEHVTKRVAKQLNCEIVDLTNGLYSIVDFVSAIANSKYVITTSFHATAFALIFNIPLASFVLHDGLDSRYVDLLKKIGAESFLYEIQDAPYVGQPINWEDINNRLAEFRQKSMDFLIESIS